jgi:uncharacterized protein YjbI with pentapeptide repeats
MSRISRTLITIIVFTAAACVGYLNAQSVSASEVIDMVNSGKNVELSNVTIEGNLDFTQLDNMRETNTGGDRKSFRSTVKVNLSFSGCTFTGRIMGYVNEANDNWRNQKEPIFHANFDGKVEFVNCVFQDDAHFKYSEFADDASFRGTEFREDALFKYTEFEEPANFSGAKFTDEANFKYTEFTDGVSFANVEFRDDAIFKYTELRDEVSFAGAEFFAGADFKYIKFPSGTDLTNTRFGRDTDFKYATLGGKRFSR